MSTIGSLCTGIAGLDLAVAQHFDATPIWMSDDNDKASEFLSVRYPDVPNLGDLRTADPATLEVPTILTMGFPCQPVSVAGSHRGTDDDRWLFDDICVFIERLSDRPELLVIENVRNLLSHDQGRTAHRVVSQVAALGYDLRWGVVRASDAGLPHRRERFFAVGTHRRIGWPTPWTATATYPDPPRLEGPEPARRHDVLTGSSYEAAVCHWELISGRPCPPPLDDKARLNPAFTEWVMGFAPGYVTDVITTRTHSLSLLGNSVSPPQAALALELLIAPQVLGA